MRARTAVAAVLLFFLSLNSRSLSAETYPQIDVTGYKQYSYTKLTVDDIANTFPAQAMLGGYYTAGPWQEKLKLSIVGKLTDKLSVSYDLEQQPDLPDKFDVKVTYDKTELTFGDFQANFGGNEFATTSKFLNGVMITSKDTWYDLTFVPSSKLKSETQGLVSQHGNNTKGPYNLGHGSIVDGSERIELNNVLLTRGADYTINYFEGKVTFSRILSADDEFKYSYEFTNLVDLFFPTISKRDFFGIQASARVDPSLIGVPARKAERSIKRTAEYFPTILTIPPTNETAPATPEASATQETIVPTPEARSEIEEFEWESTGNYRLQHSPVVQYSETITFMGTRLKKFEDYIINYQDGTIALLRPNLPSAQEPLMVDYEYLDVAVESETMPGMGKGPYSLAHGDINEGSEIVYVNNIPYIRDVDYRIDYKAGKLMFYTNIPQTANVVAKYKYLVITTPPPPVAPGVPRSLNLGVTYLKESGKRAAAAPTESRTDTRSGPLLAHNTIWLDYWPVPTFEGVEVKKNGATLVYGVDYVFPVWDASIGALTPEVTTRFVCDAGDTSDGLKLGIIQMTDTVLSTDEVIVSYEYSKWSFDRYIVDGTEADLTYPLRGVRNMVRGQEQVEITLKNDASFRPIPLAKNSGVGATDGQYSINYMDTPRVNFNSSSFTVYDPNTGGNRTFNLNELKITVKYRFIAEASASDQDISHDVAGFNGDLKIGDYLSLRGSFARSKTDQVFTTATTNETINGDGTNQNYSLHSPGLIMDGSEQVYMNSIKLNRDDQYLFSYSSPGSIFFFIVPASTDSISIDYEYQSQQGPESTVKEKQGNAYMIGGGLKPLSFVELAADYKKVDTDFAPMGGIPIPLGSEFKHAYTKLTPLPMFLPTLWLSGDLKESNVPLANQTDKYLHSSDKNLNGGFNTMGYAQINFGYRDYSTIDDLVGGSEIHNNDFKLEAYNLSIAPSTFKYGVFSYTPKMDGQRTISYTDTKDLFLPKDTKVDYYHMGNSFGLTDRINGGVDYQVNLANTVSYEPETRIRGHTVAKTEVDDLASNLNIDLTFGWLKKLYSYWNKQGHNQYDFIAGTRLSTVNETIHADCIPIDQLTTSVDHNRQETPTISTAYGNPKSERSSANVRLVPYSNTALGWAGSKDDSLSDNGVKTSGVANTYNVDHTPISETAYRLDTKYALSTSLRTAPLGIEPQVTTDQRTFTQKYNLTFNPTSAWTLTSGFIQEDLTSNNNSNISSVETKSQSQTISMGTSYKYSDDLDLSGNYGVKVTKIPDLSAHKAMLDAHAVYKVIANGTLNYDWLQEDNGGEIVGSAFAGQDFTKVIQSLSLNISVPQSEQMILSSIVVSAAVRWAKYTDRKNKANDFEATLLTFEGTLNF